MSDIVERLRIRQPLLGTLCDEAADAIERLSAEAVLHDKQDGDNAREISRLNAHITKQDTEIARLRGIVQFGETASRQQREGFQAELERLTAALREIIDDESRSYVAMQMIARAALEGK